MQRPQAGHRPERPGGSVIAAGAGDSCSCPRSASDASCCPLLWGPTGRLGQDSKTWKTNPGARGRPRGRKGRKAERKDERLLPEQPSFPGSPRLSRPASLLWPQSLSGQVRGGSVGRASGNGGGGPGASGADLGPQPAGGGGALNRSLCLDPRPALTPCAPLAERTPAEMPWSGWLRLAPSSALPRGDVEKVLLRLRQASWILCLPLLYLLIVLLCILLTCPVF